jgi:copper resistance protein B
MMRLSILFAPLLFATPALAQSMDHSMHQMPAAPAPAQAPHHHAPAPAKTPAPAQGASEAPASDDAMDALAWPESPPTSGGAADAMPGMDHSKMDHAATPGMDMESEEKVGDAPPPPAPTDHAADRYFDQAAMERARRVIREEHGGGATYKVMANLAEVQIRDGEDGYRWDGEAWFGGDLNRLVVKSEGEGGFDSGLESGEIQALYSRAISPYFDLQVGIRQDIQQGPKRTFATIGFEGLAPYWFETEGALFLSTEGELLGRLEGTYDLRLTQRWILQPRLEANLSAQDIPELGLGSGLTNLEAGLRLRYEVTREFAPYVGVSWDRKFGGTADFARAAGNDALDTSLVLGVRTWF